MLDRREEQRVRGYAARDSGRQQELYALAHKLACVAEAFRASGSERTLCRQLRGLKAEAAGLLQEGCAAPGL